MIAVIISRDAPGDAYRPTVTIRVYWTLILVRRAAPAATATYVQRPVGSLNQEWVPAINGKDWVVDASVTRSNQHGQDPRADADLVEAVRSGDRDAFGELYFRYLPAAIRFAGRLLGSTRGADDAVAEAFAKILRRLTLGGGPVEDFRPYLFTTVRTTVYKQLAGEKMIDLQSELSDMLVPAVDGDSIMDRFEIGLAVRAFRSLPERWQLTLRYLEVEGRSVMEVAELLGMHANAVAALAFRARNALRIAYLQMHVKTDVDSDCLESATNLAAWLCGRLNRGVRYRVELHLHDCPRCSSAAHELSDSVSRLGRMVPFAVNRSSWRPASTGDPVTTGKRATA